MVTTHPATPVLPPALGRPIERRPLARATPETGSWRYRTPNYSRGATLVAAVLSAAFHVVVFFGISRHQPVVPAVVEEKPNIIRIEMPELKDLDDPEPVVTDEAPRPDDASYAPTLMDVPNRIALPTDFVQKIDFASLIPPPDLNQAKVFVIPGNIARGPVTAALNNIFNLADLDRVPEPIVQPSPLFPPSLKREVDYAKVVVEFIVDQDGKVTNPVVVETTHSGFNDAALFGVSRWRFRAGMKSGKKVRTRMSVPIIFHIVERDS